MASILRGATLDTVSIFRYNKAGEKGCLWIPVSKAQQKAVCGYIQSSCDRIASVAVPKGRKADIQAHAPQRGKGMNGFVNRAPDKMMALDTENGIAAPCTRFEDVIKLLPYCDEAKLFDNDDGFVFIAEYRNGELLPAGDHRPVWLCEWTERLEPKPSRGIAPARAFL